MAFLHPDGIAEDILLQGSHGLGDIFSFLSDEMKYVTVTDLRWRFADSCSLGDASEELLRAALINRAADSKVLSLHRLVQSAAMRRIEGPQQARYLDAVVQMLSWGFPDHWSKDIGHQFAAWSRCEKCLPHIYHLSEQKKLHDASPGDHQKYAELLLRCSWYVFL